MGNDGQWKVLSDNNIDVVFDVNNSQNYIEPFINKMPGNTTGTKQPKKHSNTFGYQSTVKKAGMQTLGCG